MHPNIKAPEDIIDPPVLDESIPGRTVHIDPLLSPLLFRPQKDENKEGRTGVGRLLFTMDTSLVGTVSV